MKRYTLLYTLLICINSLAVCNARPLSRRTSDKPASTSGSQAAGRDIIRTGDHIRPRSTTSDQLQVPITNSLGFGAATVDVQIGGETYAIVIDTLGANTWIGANSSNPYRPSNSSTDTGQDVEVTYDSAFLSGKEFIDVMEFTGTSQQFMQSFGSPNSSASFGFDGVDGVVGIGKPIQNINTLSPNGSVFPTIIDTLLENDMISKNVTGIFIPPLAANTSGSLNFGGASPDGLTSEIQFVPIPAGFGSFWAFDVSITYGDGNQSVPILEGGQCIIDTAVAFTSLPIKSFNTFAEQVGVIKDNDNSTFFARIDDATKLQNMYFHIGNQTYNYTTDGQMWPRKFNPVIGGAENQTFLLVNNFTASNSDNLCHIGWGWAQRFYMAFDGENSMVGIANTNYTLAVLNQ